MKTGIVTDCVCDLPKSCLREHGISVVYFLIETDSGVFTDTDEITSENIIGYMEAGGEKSMSMPPPPEVYRDVFRKKLSEYEEVIFIAISGGVSRSFETAVKAVEDMGEEGKRIKVFDSGHLSTGLGLIVLRAAEMAEDGKGSAEIIPELEKMRGKVSTSFITADANYLHRTGRVSLGVKRLVDALDAHPVLTLRDGRITLKTVLFGSYENACLRYVRRQLRHHEQINKERIFITHVGCSLKKLERIKEEAAKKCRGANIIVTKASATISSSCGPDTFGILFVRED